MSIATLKDNATFKVPYFRKKNCRTFRCCWDFCVNISVCVFLSFVSNSKSSIFVILFFPLLLAPANDLAQIITAFNGVSTFDNNTYLVLKSCPKCREQRHLKLMGLFDVTATSLTLNIKSDPLVIFTYILLFLTKTWIIYLRGSVNFFFSD